MTNAMQKQPTTSSRNGPRPACCFHGYMDPIHQDRVHCIYLYYVNATGTTVYLYDNGSGPKDYIQNHNDLINIITALTDSAASGGTVLPPRTRKFETASEKLCRRAYIAVVVDILNWQFRDKDPVSFKIPNISLYNADVKHKIKIYRNQPREVSLFYCINHLKKELSSDHDLGKKITQPFKFELHPTAEAFDSIQADGTNLGPPVPPPSGGKIRFPFYIFPFSLLIKALKKMNNLLGI